MSKQSEFEKLQKKIDMLLKLNKELHTIGMCNITHDGVRGYLQACLNELVDLSKKYGLETNVTEWDKGDGYRWEVSIPALKMFAIATDTDLEVTGLSLEKV